MPKQKSIDVEGTQTDTLPEYGAQEPIESVKGPDFKTAAEKEAFMQEKLVIVVATTTDKSRPKVIVPQVNGINQPILRGVKQTVKRKYVEAMLRNRVTRYEQVTPNPMLPEKKIMQEASEVAEPFQIIYDPNPKGPAWAEAIMAEK
jgi:hypothetical protein